MAETIFKGINKYFRGLNNFCSGDLQKIQLDFNLIRRFNRQLEETFIIKSDATSIEMSFTWKNKAYKPPKPTI